MASAAVGKPTQRVLAVDVLRGLVLFFLLPDLAGGFSFYAVAQAIPQSPFWRALAAQFQHVEWTGVALWDLVMPLFVFLVGVAMALSYVSRRDAGLTEASLFMHAVVRSLALLVLGMLLQFRAQTRFDELLPLLVLTIGLPVGRGWRRLFARADVGQAEYVEWSYALIVLIFVAGWMAAHYTQLGHYEIGSQILALLGLAYLPAYLLQRQSVRVQAVAIVALLASYWLAYMIYPAPEAAAGAHVFTGVFAHWSSGANLGAAFDAWFFPLLPRSEAYRGNPHDYHSLQFVPLIAAILFGAIVGLLLVQYRPSRSLAWQFSWVSLAGLALAGLMSQTVAPLLKSLWTPTWSVFSSSVCLLMLSGLMLLYGTRQHSRWALPWVVLGTNSVLLYVLAFTQRWRIVNFWDKLLGATSWPSLPWWPLAQSCLVLLTLWALAFALYRAKIFVRL